MSPLDLLRFARRAKGRPARVVRTLAADSRRTFWALVDQGIVSLGSFGVNVLLGYQFDRQQAISLYGDFWTLMELMIFLNGLQSALIVYPLTLRGASSDEAELGRLTGLSLMLTFLSWPVQAGAILLTTVVAHIPTSVGIWASIALLMWQTQETTRRGLMAHLRFAAPIMGDTLSYVGQVVAVAALAWAGNLTLVSTFQIMALTSGLAALAQASQTSLRPAKARDLPPFASDCWATGRWALAGNLMNFIGPMYAWNMRYWLGDTMLGINYAITNLLRPTNPLTFAITSMITPYAARTKDREGMRSAKKIMVRFGLVGVLLLTPYLGMLLLFPKFSLALAYGSNSRFLEWSIILRITTLAAAATYFATLLGAFLNAVRQSWLALVGQSIYAVATLLIAFPLVARYGLVGSACGWLLVAVLQACLNAYFVFRLPDEPATQQAQSSRALSSQT